MSRSSALASFMCPLWLGLAACASAPVQEMSNARQTIDAARAAGAERIAPAQLAAASELLGRAEKALRQQDYRLARRRADEAHRRAQEALELATSADSHR